MPNPPPTLPDLSGEHLRFVLGLKLKSLRQEKGAPLKSVAARSGLSISYLSEIEKGKKYPTPEKLIRLAQALDVSFDALVSQQVAEDLDPVKAVFASGFLKEFPFGLFGIAPEDLFGLVTQDPHKAGALLRTFLEIGRIYDVHVEHFLLAALRSYQQMHANFFGDLEESAKLYRQAHGWSARKPPSFERLRATLQREHGYALDERTLTRNRELAGLRSVFRDGSPPTLLLNDRLMPSQKAFVLAREIGYRHLGLSERALTSTWIKVESFEQVLNNFKASYFAGALLIDAESLRENLRSLFEKPRWDGSSLVACMRRYDATPETFFYRLTQLVPQFFGLREIFFLRFNDEAGSKEYRLTKVFNLSRVPVPHGVGADETYCRRWPALRLLRELADSRRGRNAKSPLVAAQRSFFLNEGAEFFVMAMARPLALSPESSSSVSIGFLLDDAFREHVRFWNDPKVPRVEVNLTCERCPLAPTECRDRAAPPLLYRQEKRRRRKEEAVRRVLERPSPTSSL